MGLSLLAFILVLGVLIILHEAGHFLAARAVGAPVVVNDGDPKLGDLRATSPGPRRRSGRW